MNNYWEYVVYSDLFNNIDVDTEFKSIVESMTRQDIQTTLQELLKQKNRIEVTMTN